MHRPIPQHYRSRGETPALLGGIFDGVNIVLIGYRGTGKSSVATALADRLGWPRVSTDTEIVARAKQSIPEIIENAKPITLAESVQRSKGSQRERGRRPAA